MGYQISPIPLRVYPEETRGSKTLYVFGDPVYYGETPAVSSASHDGTLTSGQSLTITDDKYFVTSPNIGGGIPGSARMEFVDPAPFQGPKGDTGAQGAQGVQGIQGAPGTSTVLVAGIVLDTGSSFFPNGFTSARIGPGLYTVTFTSAFASVCVPVVSAAVANTVAAVPGRSTSGFSVTTTVGGTPTDCAFYFMACAS